MPVSVRLDICRVLLGFAGQAYTKPALLNIFAGGGAACEHLEFLCILIALMSCARDSRCSLECYCASAALDF